MSAQQYYQQDPHQGYHGGPPQGYHGGPPQGYHGGPPQYPQPAYPGPAPQQGYYPPQGQMQYQEQPRRNKSGGGDGCLKGCLAALCCCFVCEEGCECCADCCECCMDCC